MSKIKRLSILGVRSFDNVRSEAIEFFHPLTLIVGLNGSGKTTIIECLKYITTGELPPNTKVGGAFIHDPKLCGEKEVLAQIKVSLTSTEGHNMVCTRNMSLTVKKNSRSFKSVEGNLVISRNGEKLTVSSQMAEISSMMPDYLGVSKAILTNVIFCHQEESLWPLAKSSDLKVKFDEIFDALKYTKAIDNIKVLQKQKRIELVTATNDREHNKVNKDRAHRLHRTIQKLYDDIEALRAEQQKKEALIEEVIQKESAAWQKANTADQIVGKLNGKRIEETSKDESVQSLLENLEEMSDSDEALQNMLEQYDERVQVYEDDLERQKGHYRKIEQQVQDTRNQVSAKERECGSYEAQKQSYDRQVQNREKLIKETARTHGVRGFDMDIDDKQVEAFMDRISKMARDQNNKLESVRQETRDELQSIQTTLNQHNEQKTTATQRKESARQSITTNDNKINRLQGELNKINVDEGAKVAMESSLQETEAKLEATKSDIGSVDYDGNIESAEADLRKLDDQKEKLETELMEGTTQAGDSARLDFAQKELKAKRSSLETMIGAHGDKIGAVVGPEWTRATLDTKFQRSLEQHRAQVTEAEKQRDGTSRELQQVDYQLGDCRKDLKEKRAVVKKAEKAIREAVDAEPANYHEEVKKLEEGRDFAKADTDSVAQLLEYLDACLKASTHGCRTCTRKFANDQEKEKMIKTVENEKKKYQTGSGEAKQDLEDLEKDLQAAKAVSADFDAWERLTKKEIPTLEKTEKELSEKRGRLITQAEDQDAIVGDRQSAKRDVESITKTVQTISNYSNEVTNFESQIEDLIAKQKAAGISRGLEIIRDEIKKLNNEARSVKFRLTKSTGDRDRQKTYISSLELEISRIEAKISNAEYQLKDKKSLEGQVEDHKASNGDHRETVRSCDKELEDLAPKVKQEQVKHDDAVRRGTEKDRELQAAAGKLDSSVNQLKMAGEEISAYIEKGGPQQLARGRREVDNLKEETTHLQKEQSSIVREVKTLEEKLRNHSDTRRSISNNQWYRRDLRALETVRAEIAELETHNAEEDKANYEREAKKYGDQRTKLSAEKSSLVGELKTKDEDMLDKEQEYETEYKGAARKFKESHVKVETTQACMDDLGRYGGALDKAIMKFHSIKMEEINRIIDELWRKTYQGTDIDTILIRSESENSAAAKSYNYRVCMVKQDAEMDMRGRCSAGQKVLASIIIRLALAECFGVNCGLIALDEPTTNLDSDNIEALARSLAEIIKMRQVQKNFQLIVITHDEDFLRAMGCSEHAQSYYRVSRNDRQKSVIEKQNIAQVM